MEGTLKDFAAWTGMDVKTLKARAISGVFWLRKFRGKFEISFRSKADHNKVWRQQQQPKTPELRKRGQTRKKGGQKGRRVNRLTARKAQFRVGYSIVIVQNTGDR